MKFTGNCEYLKACYGTLSELFRMMEAASMTGSLKRYRNDLIIWVSGDRHMSDKIWNVYLSGEIHSDWRERITAGVEAAGLPVAFNSPVTVHEDSDDCGVAIFGKEDNKYWHDHKGAMLNSVRTSNLLRESDVVIVRFGEKYKQWNAAFDAGQAAALGIPYITLHPEAHDHALKEVDGAAAGMARTPEQIVEALVYVIDGKMPNR